jgi:hypothetical protein
MTNSHKSVAETLNFQIAKMKKCKVFNLDMIWMNDDADRKSDHVRTEEWEDYLEVGECRKLRHDLCFFFYYYLGPVCLSSGSTSALTLIVHTLNFHQHRFSIPVSLMKRQRSLSEDVLISFGSTNGFPKVCSVDDVRGDVFQSPSRRICRMDLH